MENIVLLSAYSPSLSYHQNQDRFTELKHRLQTLGLENYSVKIENVKHLMIVTKDLAAMKKLAADLQQKTFYISDSKRNLFKLDMKNPQDLLLFFGSTSFVPTKLGKLKRTEKELAQKSSFCLVVEENGSSYYYSAQ